MTMLTPPEAVESCSAERMPLILVVDDDPTGREMISCLLDEAGLCCIAVGSGVEALDLCGCCDRLPRLVITDLCMPGLDGKGLGERLRAQFPGIALILITAETLDDFQLGELQCTFDEVHRKPVDCDRFLDRVCSFAL